MTAVAAEDSFGMLLGQWLNEIKEFGPTGVATRIEKYALTDGMIKQLIDQLVPVSYDIQLLYIFVCRRLISSSIFDSSVKIKLQEATYTNLQSHIKQLFIRIINKYSESANDDTLEKQTANLKDIINLAIYFEKLIYYTGSLNLPNNNYDLSWDFSENLYILSSVHTKLFEVYLYFTENGFEVTKHKHQLVLINRLMRMQHECYYNKSFEGYKLRIANILDKIHPLRDYLPEMAKATLYEIIDVPNRYCNACNVDMIEGEPIRIHITDDNDHNAEQQAAIMKRVEDELKTIDHFAYCVVCQDVAVDVEEHVEDEKHVSSKNSFCYTCGIPIIFPKDASIKWFRTDHFNTATHWISMLAVDFEITETRLRFLESFTNNLAKDWGFRIEEKHLPPIVQSLTAKKVLDKESVKHRNLKLEAANLQTLDRFKKIIKKIFQSTLSKDNKSKLLHKFGFNSLFYEDVFHLYIGHPMYLKNIEEIVFPKNNLELSRLFINKRRACRDTAIQKIKSAKLSPELDANAVKAAIINLFESKFIPYSLVPKCLQIFNEMARNEFTS